MKCRLNNSQRLFPRHTLCPQLSSCSVLVVTGSLCTVLVQHRPGWQLCKEPQRIWVLRNFATTTFVTLQTYLHRSTWLLGQGSTANLHWRHAADSRPSAGPGPRIPPTSSKDPRICEPEAMASKWQAAMFMLKGSAPDCTNAGALTTSRHPGIETSSRQGRATEARMRLASLTQPSETLSSFARSSSRTGQVRSSDKANELHDNTPKIARLPLNLKPSGRAPEEKTQRPQRRVSRELADDCILHLPCIVWSCSRLKRLFATGTIRLGCKGHILRITSDGRGVAPRHAFAGEATTNFPRLNQQETCTP